MKRELIGVEASLRCVAANQRGQRYYPEVPLLTDASLETFAADLYHEERERRAFIQGFQGARRRAQELAE